MIEKLWLEYFKEVILPVNPGESQIIESRRCFYAGVAAMFSVTYHLGDIPEEDGCTILDNISQELNDYSKEFYN